MIIISIGYVCGTKAGIAIEIFSFVLFIPNEETKRDTLFKLMWLRYLIECWW